MRKTRMFVVLLLAAVSLVACGGGGSGGDDARTVLVDYRHDETETSLFDYYPNRIKVRQGDTVEFKQAWTGEPHSVTFGSIVEPVLGPIVELVRKVEKSGEIPKEEPPEFAAFDAAKIPFALTDDEEDRTIAVQNAAQPCYVEKADAWPGDEKTPCPQRPQPAFTGRDAVYSSGLIPYEGVRGNSFVMPVAEDATPGTYSYFCNVHGPLQYGQVEVVDKDADVASPREVAKAARRSAEAKSKILVANHAAARAGKKVTGGEPGNEQEFATKGKRLIGVPSPFFHDGKIIHGIINEFVPKNDSAKVGEKVTWTFAGHHTISFNVPKYFPVFTVAKDGTVEFNAKVGEPAGWPGPPERPEDEGPEGEGQGEGGDGEGGGGEGGEGDAESESLGEGPPAEEPVRIDAGPWDGRGFRSTGLGFPDGAEFSVTFTRRGTYPFACLIHPSMVGKIVIK